MNKTILSLAAFVAASTLTINAENVNTTDTDSANVETAQRPHKHCADEHRIKYAPVDLDTDNGARSRPRAPRSCRWNPMIPGALRCRAFRCAT